MSSLRKSLRPSTRGWSRPKGPTREGPQQDRVCDRAERDAEYDRDLDDREEQEDFEVGQMVH